MSLTLFFILLTLSIELVSVNLPLTVKAQDNGLSQRGNSNSGQEIEQGQASSQVSQVVSGDSSMLSGNNAQCQNQENLESLQGLTETCNVEQTILSLFGKTVKLHVETIDELCGCTLLVKYGNERDGFHEFKRQLTEVTPLELDIRVGDFFAVIIESNFSITGVTIDTSDCNLQYNPDKLFICAGIKASSDSTIVISSRST